MSLRSDRHGLPNGTVGQGRGALRPSGHEKPARSGDGSERARRAGLRAETDRRRRAGQDARDRPRRRRSAERRPPHGGAGRGPRRRPGRHRARAERGIRPRAPAAAARVRPGVRGPRVPVGRHAVPGLHELPGPHVRVPPPVRARRRLRPVPAGHGHPGVRVPRAGPGRRVVRRAAQRPHAVPLRALRADLVRRREPARRRGPRRRPLRPGGRARLARRLRRADSGPEAVRPDRGRRERVRRDRRSAPRGQGVGREGVQAARTLDKRFSRVRRGR